MDAGHRPVWEYSEGLEHPLAAQRLANGDTVIGDAKLGKVIEVNPTGKVVWKYENPDMANMRMRSVRRTEAGTTLISIEAAGKIIEVDHAGKVIWTFEAPGGGHRTPYQAHRLANGNTMVGLADPGEVVEVDPAGKIVRSIAGAKDNLKMGWCSGTQLLPGGAILISDYSGKRLIEVDSAGNVKHELPTGDWGIASVSLAR
jgi:outer membrane protein assembly factor BamB